MNLSGEIIDPIVLYWNIRINHQDDWWGITSSSPMSGSLNTGENDVVNVQVDRAGKTEGEYEGSFIVESYGANYTYDVEVTLVMEVGNPTESIESECITNTDNIQLKNIANNLLQSEANDSSEIDTTGYYNITKLQKEHSYIVVPSKIRDSSVTTITMYDASLAAQIAVRLFQNPTEHQRIAADVDKNGIISAHDASLILVHQAGEGLTRPRQYLRHKSAVRHIAIVPPRIHLLGRPRP